MSHTDSHNRKEVTYDKHIDESDVRYKGKDASHDGLEFDGDEPIADQVKLMMLLNDAKILLHKKPVCFLDHDDDNIESIDRKTRP